MANESAQPLTVFSRDLKYMLDARHSAAPPRRATRRRVVVFLVAAAVAVGAWTGTRLTTTGEGAPGATVSRTSGSPAPDRADAVRRVEYTQTAQRVSKAVDATLIQRVDPHPDKHPAREPRIEWKSYSIRSGDTLGGIFNRFSIDVQLASTIVKHETGAALKKLMPGHEIRFGFNRDDRLVQLRYELNRMDELLIHLDDPDALAVTRRRIPTEIRERSVSQSIGSSLFLSASRAGLSDRLIMELVSIFGWDIDFALDIQPGDRFSILYEEMFRKGESVGTGDIVAAEFVNNGNVFHAVRHIDDDGHRQYFDLEGDSLRGAFLRTPMQISRITSGFSKRRYHPVLKKWRAHRGVDYGAPNGTPVLATADGRIQSLGRNGGYGNTIVLKHGGRYSTLYAHLSGYRKGLGNGSRVRQGEVIGYVGSTGLATGPHLHYEFRVDGVHRNPLTYETPKAKPIADHYREDFVAMARDRINQLTEARAEQIASR